MTSDNGRIIREFSPDELYGYMVDSGYDTSDNFDAEPSVEELEELRRRSARVVELREQIEGCKSY
jgi:hypothetical protein